MRVSEELLEAWATDDEREFADPVGAVRICAQQALASRRECEERNKWLAECYRLSGADPDGNEDWRLAPGAAAAVRELREGYDEASEECEEKAREIERLTDLLDRETKCNEQNCRDAREHREGREKAEAEVERLKAIIKKEPVYSTIQMIGDEAQRLVEQARNELQGHRSMIGAMEESARIRQEQFAEIERELASAQRALVFVADMLCVDCGAPPDGMTTGNAEVDAAIAAARAADLMPCGHPKSALVSSDEGTSYCRECERAARAAQEEAR